MARHTQKKLSINRMEMLVAKYGTQQWKNTVWKNLLHFTSRVRTGWIIEKEIGWMSKKGGNVTVLTKI